MPRSQSSAPPDPAPGRGAASSEASHITASLAGVARRAAEEIGAAPGGWQAVHFVKSLHANLDTVSRNWLPVGHALECQPGCSHCCSARVEVSDPEALYIAQHIMKFPGLQLEAVASRLRANLALRAASGSARVACAFLDQKMCMIYEYRPSVCRKAHSLSLKACENLEATIPQSLGLVLQHEVLITGTNRGYEASGLPASVNELSAAILAVLDDHASPENWYGGKPLLR